MVNSIFDLELSFISLALFMNFRCKFASEIYRINEFKLLQWGLFRLILPYLVNAILPPGDPVMHFVLLEFAKHPGIVFPEVFCLMGKFALI